jgi:uncharacterized membrane protein YsdA (DUF1294 family)
VAGLEKARSKSRVPLAWLARLWLVGIVLLLVVDWLASGFRLNWLTRIYFWGTLLMSLVCFAAYGIDKRRANLQKRRIPEKQLHLMEILGGWPGAVLGQQMFRHKTIKMSFRLVLWAIIGLHVALSAYFVYDAFQEKRRRERILEDAQATISRPALDNECSTDIIRCESTILI